MKGLVSYSPVVLDPNTDSPDLIVSEDLTIVRQVEEEQRLMDNPERFEYWHVLGSEGLITGTHSWEVDVTHNTNWMLGVMMKLDQQGGKCPTCGGWASVEVDTRPTPQQVNPQICLV